MDETLARGLPCSDRERMGRLLAPLESRLMVVARRGVGVSDAADVVECAFEEVLLHCERYRGGSRASTWLHRIVVNEALAWLRHARCRAGRSLEASGWRRALAALEDPEAGAARDEVRERVEHALQRLGSAERILLTANALADRPLAAVAADLGLSLGAVKSRAFRARRRLARNLARI